MPGTLNTEGPAWYTPADGPGSLHLWAAKEYAENGERIFDALWNGERWTNLQVRAHITVQDTRA